MKPLSEQNKTEHFDSIKVTKWVNQCQYDCKMCHNFTTQSKVRFVKHLQSSHDGISKTNYRLKFKTLESEVARVKCAICKQKVLHEKKALAIHLQQHQYTIRNYYFSFVCKGPEAQEDKKPGNLQQHSIDVPKKISQEFISHEERSATQPTIVLNKMKDSTQVTVWANQCNYDCKICHNFTTRSKARFVKHLRSSHEGFSKTTYRSKFKTLESEVVHVKCAICKQKVLHEKKALKVHMQQHQYTIRSYYFSFVCKGPKTQEEKKSGSHQQRSMDVTEIPSQEIDGYKEKPAITKWVDQCVFTCKSCGDYANTCHASFQTHVARKHKLNVAEYIAKHGHPMTVRYMQSCEICNAELTLTYSSFYRHMKDVHIISLAEYFNQYVKDKPALLVKKIPFNQSISKGRLVKQDLEARIWASKIQFKCLECQDFDSVYIDSFLTHLKKTHQMQIKQYREKYPSTIAIEEHQCKICGRFVKWHFRSLYLHLKIRSHSITVTEYYIKHVKSETNGSKVPDDS